VEERSSPTNCTSHILESVPHSVIVTAPDGAITYWNRGAEALFGWSAGEVLGQNVLTVTPSEAMVKSAADIMGQLRAGTSWSGEFALRRRDGTRFTAWVTDAPIIGPNSTLLGIVGITIDLAELGREPLASQEEAARLHGAPPALYTVSHELHHRQQLVRSAEEGADVLAPQTPHLRSLLRQAREAPEDTTQDLRTLAPNQPAPPVPDREVLLTGLTERLTGREYQVLQLLALRCSNGEIATELCLSWQTAVKLTNNIYRKLGVVGRREAVERAVALGMLPVGSATGDDPEPPRL
jgi:PAS domain S-box-containing protein